MTATVTPTAIPADAPALRPELGASFELGWTLPLVGVGELSSVWLAAASVWVVDDWVVELALVEVDVEVVVCVCV